MKRFLFECYYLDDVARFLNHVEHSNGGLISVVRLIGDHGFFAGFLITYKCETELGIEIKT